MCYIDRLKIDVFLLIFFLFQLWNIIDEKLMLIIHQYENFQIVEFISVLPTIGSEAAEKALIRLGAIQQILDLFFK